MKGKGHGHMIKLLWGDPLLETSWSPWFTTENESPLSIVYQTPPLSTFYQKK